MNQDFWSVFSLSCALFLILISSSIRYRRLQKYNVRLKMKLTDLAVKTGNDVYAIYKVSKEDRDRICELKAQQKKIDAVKLLKENYSMDLFEAKAYVDYL